MDIKAYIDSGILEQFVLGNTSDAESDEIIRLAKVYPEIRSEIDAIEEALFAHAQENAMDVPDDLRSIIMAQIEEDDAMQKDSSQMNIGGAKETNTASPREGKTLKFYKYMVAASILLFGASVIGNIWLYNRLDSSEKALSAINSENRLLVDNNKIQQSSLEDLTNRMEILLEPNVKKVNLKGLPLMPEALVTVYWNENKKDVYLKANNLKEIAENEQYQLWAIIDNVPVDMGVFDTKEAMQGMVKMKDADKAVAFAITIEKSGGSVSPTLEKMVLLGNVI